MTLVNIPRSVDDMFYRYRRHTIQIGIVQKQGGMTQLKNVDIIAKEIYSNVDDILKFLQKNLYQC